MRVGAAKTRAGEPVKLDGRFPTKTSVTSLFEAVYFFFITLYLVQNVHELKPY